MKNIQLSLIIFSIISLVSLITSISIFYNYNNERQNTSKILTTFDADIESIKSQPIANLENSLTTIASNRTLIKSMIEITEKREELIACLWYGDMILNLNSPNNPQFEDYSETYNNLLNSLASTEDKSNLISEINNYCKQNETLMYFLLEDKLKILIDKATKNND